MSNKKWGYARVSTVEQNLELQMAALRKEKVPKANIYVDKVSGAKEERVGLNELLEKMKEGETLIVWRLDRLGRSLSHLVDLVKDLGKRGIKFKSIQDGAIDTTTASGELIFNIFSCLAQFEKKLIQERTNAGLKAARARGRLGGRPKLPSSNSKVQAAKRMYKNNDMSITEICEILEVSKKTFYRYLKK